MERRQALSAADVLLSCQRSRQYLVIAHSVLITLPSQMMYITAANPHRPVSQVVDTCAKFNFVAIIGEVAIESTQLLPQTTAYEEGEP